MLSGKFQGHDLGSGTGLWQMTDRVRAGEMRLEDFFEAESCMHRSKGHFMTMGTAWLPMSDLSHVARAGWKTLSIATRSYYSHDVQQGQSVMTRG
jgi:hypothetical protein